MAQDKGLQITCNRCGKTVFLKFLGMEPQEWSQPKEKYQIPPAGWAEAVSLGRDIDLCPKCAEEWVELQTRFMKKPPEILEG